MHKARKIGVVDYIIVPVEIYADNLADAAMRLDGSEIDKSAWT